MKPKVLYGVLNWGLGHAGRSIPVINALIKNNFEVIIASDGEALKLLRSELPTVESIKITGYNVKYPYRSIILNLFRYAFNIVKAIYLENKEVKKIIELKKPDLIISDNRYGFRNKKIPSILITHQTTIHHKNSFLSLSANILNTYLLKSFDKIWIPDMENEQSLAGKLSKLQFKIPHNYIGIQSRFEKKENAMKYDIGIILSGPEPQRTFFEKILKKQILKTDFRVILIQGLVNENLDFQLTPTLHIKSHAYSSELNQIINQCGLIVARSGYSTVMDLVKLGKKAVFVPTPGQTEQEYLAEYLYNEKHYYYQAQNAFDLEKAVSESENYPVISIYNEDLLQKVISELSISKPT